MDFNALTYDERCILIFGPITALYIAYHVFAFILSKFGASEAMSGTNFWTKFAVFVLILAVVAQQGYQMLKEPELDGFFCDAEKPATGVGMGRGCWGAYCMGQPGWSCAQTCRHYGGSCNPHYDVENAEKLFWYFGRCQTDFGADWFAHDHPCYVADKNDPNSGRCLGFNNIPGTTNCDGSYHTTQRLCSCSGDLSCPK